MFIDLVASIKSNYHAGTPKHVSMVDKSFFKIIDRQTFTEMSSSHVQMRLQKGIIVVPNMNLPAHFFSRNGVRELNSLNTDVRIEGMCNISHPPHCLSDIFEDQSLPPSESDNIKTGSLQQFFHNAEAQKTRKVLRVIHAPSDYTQQQSFTTDYLVSFTTDYLAWRETQSRPYCKQEEYSSITALRWNDYENANAIQKWTLVPHGFGLYLDVRAGSKWVIVGSPAVLPFGPDDFATADMFALESWETSMINDVYIRPEAILLTEGMRM